jgi:hypothetical protein
MHRRWIALGALGGVLLASAPCNAATVVHGSVGAAQTWEASGNPYLVDSDLTIEASASLTLAAGVDVQLANQDAHDTGSDAARVELIVKGELHAEGTLTAPVLLHAQDDEFANSWHGIVIDAGAKAVTLDHVELFSAGDAVSSAATGQVLKLTSSSIHHNFNGISLTAGVASLERLLVFDNAVAGVYAQASEGDVVLSLTNSAVRLNGSYGVFVSASHTHDASASIDASTFYGNISAGVTAKAS